MKKCKNKRCSRELENDFLFCPWCGKSQAAQERKPSKRPNGTGSIYKRKDNKSKPWAVASSVTGKRNYIGSYATVTEAKRALQEYEYNPVSCFNITLEELHLKWIKTKAYGKLSTSSQQGYNSAWIKLKSVYTRNF